MDLVQLVINHIKANNAVLSLRTDEIYEAQKAVIEAAGQLGADKQPIDTPRLLLHDPLVGWHTGEFLVPPAATTSKKCLADLSWLMGGPQPLQLPDGLVVDPRHDIVAVLKGWETLLDPRYADGPVFIQAFTNLLAGNLCAERWMRDVPNDDTVAEMEKNTPSWVRRDPQSGRVDVKARGRRTLVLLLKSDTLPVELSDLKPLAVPLPGKPVFTALVKRQWDKMAALSKKDKKDRLHGLGAKAEQFIDEVATGLLGMTRQEAEDTIMLSLVENSGFADPGTLATLERLRESMIAKLPGVSLVPLGRIESGPLLPGYEAVGDFVARRTTVDADFARAHGLQSGVRGLFLVGPPGVGKSVACGQIARGLRKSLLQVSLGEISSKFVSEGERNIRRVWNVAEVLEANLQLDDLDKCGVSAKGSSANDGGVMDRILNTILTESAKEDSRVTLSLTANRLGPEYVRPEMYRSGRVDLCCYVDLPDAGTRQQIVEYHAAKHRFEVSGKGWDAMIKATEGWSGADLRALVLDAAYQAAERKTSKLSLAWMTEQAGDRVPQSLQAANRADIQQMRDMARDFMRIGVTGGGKRLAEYRIGASDGRNADLS